MKCDYCVHKDKCQRKFYECDRELVIHRNGDITCEPKETYNRIRTRERKREYNSEERVVFLGFTFNRVKAGGSYR